MSVMLIGIYHSDAQMRRDFASKRHLRMHSDELEQQQQVRRRHAAMVPVPRSTSVSAAVPTHARRVASFSQATEAEREAMIRQLAEAKQSAAFERALIPLQELTMNELLGQGSFGEVRSGVHRGTPVAIKKLHRSKLTEVHLRRFKEELELQIALRHPNIVTLIGGSWELDSATVCLVLELCARGTLWQVLRGQERTALRWSSHKLPLLRDVARGMAYLHSQRVTPPPLPSASRLLPPTAEHSPATDAHPCARAPMRWNSLRSSIATSSPTTCSSTRRTSRSSATLGARDSRTTRRR